MKQTFILVFLLFALNFSVWAQENKKTISAISITSDIKIDGILDENAWESAPIATDFIQRSPYNGKPATHKTEVKILYDNTGIYVGAMMYDPAPDSILKQLSLRDGSNINADYFIFVVNPFNDGLNAFCFMVHASDVQSDFRIISTSNQDDITWDAVWQSKARIIENGWVCEMKIPYSAIRFPKQAEQVWEINFQRDVRRTRETTTWSRVDNKVQGYVNQSGLLTGIRNIKPPLRLSLMPYVSGYLEQNPGKLGRDLSYNFGTDLKYGINQSFTLDMTLIPDFGQVPSDDKVYNFSPFEIRYNEKRQFFTEGTEMFDKGGIFYSRRIGAEPIDYGNIKTDSNAIISDNPVQTKLINATKVSGRTNKGLGIGLFNAMSANTWATVKDTFTGKTHRVLTQGFTNYNMIVLDQTLKNNSFFDILNTNYYIPEMGYSANVSGTSFRFANKKYTYALTGEGFLSQKYYRHASPDVGYHYKLTYGKISGKFLFDFTQLVENDKYDPNEMGFNARNNKFSNTVLFQYNLTDPFGKFLSLYNSAWANYDCLYDELKYSSFSFGFDSHITTMKHLDAGINFSSDPIDYNDYYEPRVKGYWLKTPADYNLSGWISTDYRKKLAIDFSLAQYLATAYHISAFSIDLSPRFRANDRLLLQCGASYNLVQNGIGYVNSDSTDLANNPVIVFGRRNVTTITNVISAEYMFNSRMSLNIRARHYWVVAKYYSFYRLDKQGLLDPMEYKGNEDINFNLFNLDLTYVWNFAPGSQLSLVWKNAISTFSRETMGSYFKDFGNTIESPASNSFSIRVLYYLDALYLKKKTPAKDGRQKQG